MVKRLLSHAPWIMAAIWIFIAYGPVGDPDGFHSDAAIGWMMAYSKEWSPFELYYYGQNRLGAPAVLPAKIATILFPAPYIPDFLLRSLLLFYAFHLLIRKHYDVAARWLIFTLLTLLVLSDGTLHKAFFSMPQPYLMQIVLIAGYAQVHGPYGLPIKVFLAIVGCWISPTTAIYIGMIEGIRFLAHFAGIRSLRVLFSVKTLLSVLALGMPFVGYKAENLINGFYVAWMKNEFMPLFSELPPTYFATTDITLSLQQFYDGGLLAIFKGFFADASKNFLMVLCAFAALFLLLRLVQFRHLLKEISRDETQVIIALMIAALLNAFFAALATWIRMNAYSPRYISVGIIIFFLVISLLSYNFFAASVGRWRAVARFERHRHKIFMTASIGVLALFVIERRSRIALQWQNFAELRQDARAIASLGPKIVFGNYWLTYVWQALEPDMKGVPNSHSLVREFRNFVDYRQAGELVLCSESEAPPSFIQYGKIWELKQSNALVLGLCKVSLYAVVSKRP